MRRHRSWLIALALLCPSAAAAQISESADERPIAMAFGAGGVVSVIGNGADGRVMVSIPISDTKTIEPFVAAYGGNDALHTKAVYGIQIRQRIGDAHRSSRLEPFWTYGALGAVARLQSSTCAGGRCTTSTETRVLPPLMGTVGAGVEYRLKPRLALRLDYQAGLVLFVPVGVRGAASIVIPLGARH